MATPSNTPHWHCVYAKLRIDKDAELGTRVKQLGNTVYVGCIPTPDRAEAERAARHVANTTPACDIALPRVFEYRPDPDDDNPYFGELCRAAEWFEKKLAEFNESDESIEYSARRR